MKHHAPRRSALPLHPERPFHNLYYKRFHFNMHCKKRFQGLNSEFVLQIY